MHLLEQSRRDNQAETNQGRRVNRLTEHKLDEDQGQEGGEKDEIADLGYPAGGFQGGGPEQEGEAHFEQARIDSPINSPPVGPAWIREKPDHEKTQGHREGKIEAQADSSIALVARADDPVVGPDHSTQQGQRHSPAAVELQADNIPAGRDDQHPAVADQGRQHIAGMQFCPSSGTAISARVIAQV